jgi:hypothetical protein
MAGSGILEALKSGDFLDDRRIVRWAAVFLVFAVVSVAALFLTAEGMRDRLGRPLGTDFMAFYVAGTIAADDGPLAAYDDKRQYAKHQELLSEDRPPFWPFFYPPVVLASFEFLAALPYVPALVLWTLAGLAVYVAAMQRLAPGRAAALLALAYPAVYLTALHGQTGLFIAAFFAAGLHCLFARKPLLAGIALGLIAVKPQYGLLIPVALAAAGEWRAFIAAAAALGLLAAAPALAYGPEIWPAFFEALAGGRHYVVESGAIGFEKIQSLFAQMRMAGAPVGIAYFGQFLLAAALAISVFRLWRSGAPNEVKGAALVAASLLATPYVVDYDFVILAPAVALLMREAQASGWRAWEKSILLLIAAVPLAARPIGEAVPVSLGLLALLAFVAAVRSRALKRSLPAAASNP